MHELCIVNDQIISETHLFHSPQNFTVHIHSRLMWLSIEIFHRFYILICDEFGLTSHIRYYDAFK